MLATDLIAYLTSAGFTVYPDPNFIPASLPENKYPCLFVFGTGGFAPHPYVPTERVTFQIIIKGKPYKSDPYNMANAEALAKSLIRHLHRKANFTVGSVQVFFVSGFAVQPDLSRAGRGRPADLLDQFHFLSEGGVRKDG